MSFWRSIVKYLLFFFNLIFVIIGAAVITLGALLYIKLDEIKEKLYNLNENINYINALSIFVIVIGCIIFLIAFSGCCGAVAESKCLLIMYVCIMVILVAVKIYVAVALLKNINELKVNLEKIVDQAFVDPKYEDSFQALEKSLKCCGTNGPNSYDVTKLPSACCESCNLDDSKIKNCQCKKEDAYEDGCRTLITDNFNKFAKSTAYGFIGVIAVEILAMISAIYLANTIGENMKGYV